MYWMMHHDEWMEAWISANLTACVCETFSSLIRSYYVVVGYNNTIRIILVIHLFVQSKVVRVGIEAGNIHNNKKHNRKNRLKSGKVMWNKL